MKTDTKQVELEEAYQIKSKIANSVGMNGLIEGYPVIRRGVFDLPHTDCDEDEYSCDQHEYDNAYSELNEGYAIRYKKKRLMDYDN